MKEKLKELSIEEKAKRYDEALKVAKDINSGCASYIPDGTPVIEAIFSELAESEDERIRKRLISYFKSQVEANKDGSHKVICTYNKWISWLEKQGEQNPEQYPLCETIKDKIRTYISNHFITDTIVKTDVSSIVHAMEEGVRLGKEEQKPSEWSEEDEMFVNGLIRGLAAKRDIHGHTTFSSDCIDITETINWLKFLKDRVQPKKNKSGVKEIIKQL